MYKPTAAGTPPDLLGHAELLRMEGVRLTSRSAELRKRSGEAWARCRERMDRERAAAAHRRESI